MGRTLERGRRHKDFRFAVLSLDLDRFKAVNDGLRVRVGDEVIVDHARRLEECVRSEDMVARLSGDEFAILLDEITETIAIDDPERTRGMLDELRGLGVRMYLDDFGTGYSSLGQLHRLSLDAIKIDRSFVMRMTEGPMHCQLVHTVRNLPRNIGVTVIGEGVETVQQLEESRALGCESAQGYLFSRPVPAIEMERILERDPRW